MQLELVLGVEVAKTAQAEMLSLLMLGQTKHYSLKVLDPGIVILQEEQIDDGRLVRADIPKQGPTCKSIRAKRVFCL